MNELTKITKDDEYLEFEILKPKTKTEEMQEQVTASNGKYWPKGLGKLPSMEDIAVQFMRRTSDGNGLKRIN